MIVVRDWVCIPCASARTRLVGRLLDGERQLILRSGILVDRLTYARGRLFADGRSKAPEREEYEDRGTEDCWMTGVSAYVGLST